MFKLLVLLSVIVSPILGQTPTRAYLYSGENYEEDSDYIMVIKNDIEDVSSIELLNGVPSACGQGAWVMYSETNYTGTSALFAGHADCGSGFLPQVGSVRYLGRVEDTQIQTMNVFQEEWFRGTGGVTQGDVISWGPARSLVITGTRPWQIYSETFFSGESVCVQPIDAGDGYYFAYISDTTSETVNFLVKSFHAGCL